MDEKTVHARKRKLRRQAKAKGVRDEDAYVYGTLRKMGWKPSREKTAGDAGNALAGRS